MYQARRGTAEQITILPMVEDPSFRRTASHIIEAIGDMGIDVLVEQYGLNAEGGWLLTAFRDTERWRVRADTLLAAAVELTWQVGFELEG